MRRRLFGLSLAVVAAFVAWNLWVSVPDVSTIPIAFAQGGTPADCQITKTFTAAGVSTAEQNKSTATGGTPCNSWTLTYYTQGSGTVSGLSIQLETAPDSNGSPGSFTAVPNSICSSSVQPPCLLYGSNPLTDIGGQVSTSRVYSPWLRVNLGTFSKSGAVTVFVRIYGYKGVTSAGGGGSGGGTAGPTGPPGPTGPGGPTGPAGASGPVPLALVIDGGGSAIAAGLSAPYQFSYACTLTGWSAMADQAGSASVDVDLQANSAPPSTPVMPDTTTDKISASAPIVLSGAQTASGGAAAVSAWSTTIPQWAVVQFNVTSAATITRLTLELFCTR